MFARLIALREPDRGGAPPNPRQARPGYAPDHSPRDGSCWLTKGHVAARTGTAARRHPQVCSGRWLSHASGLVRAPRTGRSGALAGFEDRAPRRRGLSCNLTPRARGHTEQTLPPGCRGDEGRPQREAGVGAEVHGQGAVRARRETKLEDRPGTGSKGIGREGRPSGPGPGGEHPELPARAAEIRPMVVPNRTLRTFPVER